MTEPVDIDKLFQHWVASSDMDYKTMQHLYDAKDYCWSLFLGHLVLEKLLKAAIVRMTKDHAPFLHDLSKLAQLSGLDFSEEQLDWLDTITAFNLNARYDSYRQAFYEKCTHIYSEKWISNINNLRTWIRERL